MPNQVESKAIELIKVHGADALNQVTQIVYMHEEGTAISSYRFWLSVQEEIKKRLLH